MDRYGQVQKGLNRFKLTRFKCKDSLRHWVDAPMVVLKSWNDLYPTVAKLMEDMEGLNEMQIHLREWYDRFMSGVISDFEDYMIDSYI